MMRHDAEMRTSGSAPSSDQLIAGLFPRRDPLSLSRPATLRLPSVAGATAPRPPPPREGAGGAS
eukprot:173736-Prorocentrum_minimum.AAC.1